MKKIVTFAAAAASALAVVGCTPGASAPTTAPTQGGSTPATASPTATESPTPTPSTQPLDCGVPVNGKTVNGDITVPKDAKCVLDGVTVNGKISIRDHASLELKNAKVTGEIMGDVYENILISGGTYNIINLWNGNTATVENATIQKLESTNNHGPQTFNGNNIKGRLQCRDNDPAPTGKGNKTYLGAYFQCQALGS